MKITVSALVALVMVVASGSAASEPANLKSFDGIRYRNLENTFMERFVLDESKGVMWWQGVPISKEGSYAGTDMATLNDCSDLVFNCVFGAYRVFAVPRDGLRVRSQYVSGGASFKVEMCLKSEGDRCQTALVSSTCPIAVAPNRCEQLATAPASDSKPGYVGYFFYDDRFGITSYGAVRSAAKNPSSQRAAACQLLLRSRSGLLARATGSQRRKFAPKGGSCSHR